MLADFPDDFRYVLGLQEAVVVGMADGYAQAAGTVGHVNLHTAPGVGNAMGAIFNAQANHSPLLDHRRPAGPRPAITMQANLTNRDATRMPHPLVKWSYEPPRAADVPAAIGRAIHTASLPPKGPAFVSIPMDDWTAEADADGSAQAIARRVDGRGRRRSRPRSPISPSGSPPPRNPVLVAGPDIDASGGWDHAVALAERQHLPVWAIPATGGGRLGFPESHANFQGVLPPAIGPVAETLAGHDLILVAGASVFPYYPYIPGDLLPEGAELVAITSDPDEAARAPMGEAIVADVGADPRRPARRARRRRVPAAPLPSRATRRWTPPRWASRQRRSAAPRRWRRSARRSPTTASSSSRRRRATLALRNQLRLSRPGSYYFGAGGGLGFGLAAAVGVQLAQPDRPVVCVVGEGSAQYAITAFWSAVAYDVPVTFLVLRNSEYAILKWFSLAEGVEGAPGPRPAGARRRRGRRRLRRPVPAGRDAARSSSAR